MHYRRLTLILSVLLVTGLMASPAFAKPKKKGVKKSRAKPAMVVYRLENMSAKTKTAEIRKLKKGLKKVKGVGKVVVNKKKGRVTIFFKKGIEKKTIEAAVAKSGFVVKKKAKAVADENTDREPLAPGDMDDTDDPTAQKVDEGDL